LNRKAIILFVALTTAPAAAEPESPEYPHVRLTIDAPAGQKTWILRIQNTDSIPLRLVADPHLLSLDVTPPGPHAPTVHCTLPPEMRPDTDEERIVVVPPQLSYVDAFDPRLYCFGARENKAVAPGATVVAHFGFGSRWKRSPPYVISSEHADRSPSREILGEPAVLPEPKVEPEPDPPAGEPPSGTDPERPVSADALAVSTPERIDVGRLRDLTLSVTVKNTTARTMHLLLRPETVAIDATGPDGTVHCQSHMHPTAIAELFTTLPPHSRSSTDVLVSSLCPPEFFTRPGLYFLRASVDATRTSGAKEGIRAFVGKSTSHAPTLVRLRTGKAVEEVQ
jgi:hypothetical protein